MPVDEAHYREAEDPCALPAGHKAPGQPVQRVPSGHPELPDSARAVAIIAERRIAVLEARIAYLESQVTTDELTGLLNRRGFIDAFLRANAAARRGGPKGTVTLCDLDDFKSLNDRFGHAHGDHMLRQIGLLLRRHTRKMDAVARIGGDEFALLLIGAPLASVQRKCHQLAQALREIGIEASFGSASYDGADDEDAVLHRADMAMYEEKRRRKRAAREGSRD